MLFHNPADADAADLATPAHSPSSSSPLAAMVTAPAPRLSQCVNSVSVHPYSGLLVTVSGNRHFFVDTEEGELEKENGVGEEPGGGAVNTHAADKHKHQSPKQPMQSQESYSELSIYSIPKKSLQTNL